MNARPNARNQFSQALSSKAHRMPTHEELASDYDALAAELTQTEAQISDAIRLHLLDADRIRALEARIDELVLERARQTHVIRRLVNRESHCEHADDGRHQCKHCDSYYPTAQQRASES